MKVHLRRRVLTATAALTTGAVVALGASTTALAEPSPNIDSTQTGTLVIHKYEQPVDDNDIPNDGADHSAEVNALSLKPMSDVTFTIQRLRDYDLTTNAGWASLATLTPAQAQGGGVAKDDPVVLEPTDGNGVATASGLPLGAYLVVETGYPTGVTPVAPFLVTLPLTDPVNKDNWLYTVNVYPKNSTTSASKTVDDSGAHTIGDTVTWTILGDIPDLPDTAPIDGYKITDPLDPRLDYVSATVALTDGATDTPLTAGDDYTITPTGATAAPATVTVTFTASGLAKLQANKEKQVKVVIDTKVNTAVNASGSNGVIENTAYIYPNAASFDVEPGQPGGPTSTDTPETKFGNVTIHKIQAGTTASPINVIGAEFQVFLSESDAKNGTNPITAEDATGAVTTTWTTDSNGQLTISGLRQSGWYQDHSVSDGDPGYQWYWIVETKAPKGYSLLANPVKVAVTGTDTDVDYTVEDPLHNSGFPLPLTGGTLATGLIYGLGGAILLSVAIVLIARARRKEELAAE